MRFSTLSEGIFLFQVRSGKLIRTRLVYDRPRCSSCKIVGGHRPPLQLGCFALSVTRWAHHDFTDQTVLPGETRTSEVVPPLTGLAPNANRTPRAHARG